MQCSSTSPILTNVQWISQGHFIVESVPYIFFNLYFNKQKFLFAEENSSFKVLNEFEIWIRVKIYCPFYKQCWICSLIRICNSLTPYFSFFCLHWKLIPYIIILSSNLSKYFFKSWNLQLDSCLTIPNFEYTTGVYLHTKANKSWCFVLFTFILNFVSSIIDLPKIILRNLEFTANVIITLLRF